MFDDAILLSLKYDIKKSYQNVMDIKLQFWYTLFLNQLIPIDQVMNIIQQIFYENIGPKNAFDIWWSVLLIKNLGKCKETYREAFIKKKKKCNIFYIRV